MFFIKNGICDEKIINKEMDQIKINSKIYDEDFFKLISLDSECFVIDNKLNLNLDFDHNIDLIKKNK